MSSSSHHFSVVDYVVMASVMTISVAIGIISACTGSKQRTTTEFLVGDRTMEVLPVSLSLLATFTSAITVLGIPAEVYQHGIDFWWMVIAITFMVPAVAHLYLPIFYKLHLTSVYEYIGLRFNNVVKLIASTLYIIQMFVYLSVVLFAPALAISQVTGLSVWTSVLSAGIICTFYTSIGGLRAVIWTDMFQIIILIASLLSIVIRGIMTIGIDFIWKKNIEGDRLRLPDVSPNPLHRHTIWSLSIGGYFIWLYIYGINQSMVQRYVSLPSLRKAQLCVWLNLPMLILTFSLTSFIGLILYSFYYDCDPVKYNTISGYDQILPFFVVTNLNSYQGLPGLFLAGLFCGCLSTMSSGMNSLAAVTVTDVIRPYFGSMEEHVATHVTKFLVFFYGSLCIGFVSIVEKLGSVLTVAASFFGIIGGPLAGIFTLGIFFPWANSKGACIGLACGLFLSLWIGIGEFMYDPYVVQAPISTAGCQPNPVTKFSIGMRQDLNAFEDVLKSNKSLVDNKPKMPSKVTHIDNFTLPETDQNRSRQRTTRKSKGRPRDRPVSKYHEHHATTEVVSPSELNNDFHHTKLLRTTEVVNGTTPKESTLTKVTTKTPTIGTTWTTKMFKKPTTKKFLLPTKKATVKTTKQMQKQTTIVPYLRRWMRPIKKAKIKDGIYSLQNAPLKVRKTRQTSSLRQENFDENPLRVERNKKIPVIYRISYLWYSGVGCMATILIGLIASLITGRQDPDDLDPRLVCDVAETFLCCLPRFIREMCWPSIGMDYISEDAAVALLQQKSPPTIIATSPVDDSNDCKRECIEGGRERNVHFNENSRSANITDRVYPFDDDDVLPYSSIGVDQDYERFRQINFRSGARPNIYNSIGNGNKNSPRNVRSSATVENNHYSRVRSVSIEPDFATYSRKLRSSKQNENQPETIKMKDLARARPANKELMLPETQHLERRPSNTSTGRRGTFSRQLEPIQRQSSIRSNSIDKAFIRNNSIDSASRRESLKRTNSHRPSNFHNEPTLKLDGEPKYSEIAVSRDHHINPSSEVNPKSKSLGRNVKPTGNIPENLQKKQYKRLLSHQAERKLNLREKTSTKHIAMSD